MQSFGLTRKSLKRLRSFKMTIGSSPMSYQLTLASMLISRLEEASFREPAAFHAPGWNHGTNGTS